MKTLIKSEKKNVTIDTSGPVVIIGEKINPTGNKKLAAALLENDFDFVTKLALRQVAAGADILDVNVGVPGLDDVTLMVRVVELLSEFVDVPLCLDSPNPAALEAGLAAAKGKPLVNSVTGEEASLQAILPRIKDRGAAVIGLIMDDNGIPSTPEGRLAAAEKIVERAAQLGIPADDIVIDPLAMAVGADSQAGLVTLETIRLVREKLGVNVSVGASNVSHGLPDRPVINMTFMALAISAGLSCAITDAAKMTAVIRASDLLLGRDEYAGRYIKAFRNAQKLAEAG